MVHCVAYGCTNSSKKKKGKNIGRKKVHFFNFPQNKQMRDIWIKLLRREGYEWKPGHRLCSDHFEWSQFEQNPEEMAQLSQTEEIKFKAMLKKDAIPKFNYPSASKGPGLQKRNASQSIPKVRGAYEKRRKIEV